MRILVFCHHLELGGSQVMSIELAAAVARDYDQQIIVFATPGPALDFVRDRGLRFIAAPKAKAHPSPAMMRALLRVTSEERIDLVHAWEWPQCLDAFYALQVAGRLPVAGSNMSMGVTRFLPRSMPITYGTPALVAQARRWHAAAVRLLEPTVDLERNSPGAVDPSDFRRQNGLDDGQINLVIVSRLTGWLKLEGLERAIEATAILARKRPLRLTVVGGGPAFDQLAARAEAINAQLGRRAVVLAGPMNDPRPAYAAADIVLGMGSSILRAMAFAKPCIILGEQGFSQPFTPQTSQRFLWEGFYGIGDGDRSASRLAGQMAQLLDDPERLPALGAYGRKVVEERFSLGVGAETLNAFYLLAQGNVISRRRAVAEGLRSGLHRAAGWAVPSGIKRRVLRTSSP